MPGKPKIPSLKKLEYEVGLFLSSLETGFGQPYSIEIDNTGVNNEGYQHCELSIAIKNFFSGEKDERHEIGEFLLGMLRKAAYRAQERICRDYTETKKEPVYLHPVDDNWDAMHGDSYAYYFMRRTQPGHPEGPDPLLYIHLLLRERECIVYEERDNFPKGHLHPKLTEEGYENIVFPFLTALLEEIRISTRKIFQELQSPDNWIWIKGADRSEKWAEGLIHTGEAGHIIEYTPIFLKKGEIGDLGGVDVRVSLADIEIALRSGEREESHLGVRQLVLPVEESRFEVDEDGVHTHSVLLIPREPVIPTLHALIDRQVNRGDLPPR